jgi:DNA-binding MarR family transcriptional regulator
VEVAVVEKDLRRRAVWLTEAGARRLETAIPAWRAAEARLAELLEREGVEAVLSAAPRLARLLEDRA